ncbi:MAG: dihydroorotase [Candidatus Gastranaerophilales bacterium]|nr:dihydroorotase [Candidatus Gastranaerophilales bacterium]
MRNARIISPNDNIDDILDIKIEDGIITDISANIEGQGLDYSGKIITPGLIDMHCHLREPGFEYKETIETGTQAALNGGFAAVCPMANTNPVVDNIETLKFVLNKAAQIGKIDVFPICAVTKGLEGKELTDFNALKQAGAIAFSDDGKPVEDMELFKKALQGGELIISHAQEEVEAVKRELDALREVGGRLHFAHISTKEAIDLIRTAKAEGLNVTCETAPHYFTFTKENETVDGRFKMNPPLRKDEDVKAVIKGLQDGTIDCIATDHAPHSIEEKMKPFSQSPFGIVGFETAIGATLKLFHGGHLTINQVVEKLSANPARILGLKDQYGHIKIGQPVNLTIIDPGKEYEVRGGEFKSKCKITPFEGMRFKGKVVEVMRGKNDYNK